jgi:hypothetical protein
MTDQLKQAAMQQALNLIERLNLRGWILADFEEEVYASIAALKAALEQQPVQEPVAWVCMKGEKHDIDFDQSEIDVIPVGTFLYTAQPVQEDSCFCHEGVSLQIVSGGAAPEGYLGKVTLLIDGKYVDYVKAQPVQEPVAWEQFYPDMGKGPFTSPPLPVQRKPLTDDVLVPLKVLEAAASSLDSFCGSLGWGDADLQNMDNLFAVIEQHKAAQNIKEKNT